MNIICKSILWTLGILARLLVSLPLAICEALCGWFESGCAELAALCCRGRIAVNRAIPMPWMVELIKATNEDSDRRRARLLKTLEG